MSRRRRPSLTDYRLWTGRESIRVPGIGGPITSTGYVDLDPNTDRETDRRLITGVSDAGLSYLLYRDYDGYRVVRMTQPVVDTVTVPRRGWRA